MNICELCHVERPQLTRGGMAVCEGCADVWDYQAGMTPEEWRQDEQSIAEYTANYRDGES